MSALREPKLCGCGCGTALPTSLYNGRERRFIHNHHARLKPRKPLRWTEEDGGYQTLCWLWLGFVTGIRSGATRRGRRRLA